jgi:hypothetical protein
MTSPVVPLLSVESVGSVVEGSISVVEPSFDVVGSVELVGVVSDVGSVADDDIVAIVGEVAELADGSVSESVPVEPVPEGFPGEKHAVISKQSETRRMASKTDHGRRTPSSRATTLGGGHCLGVEPQTARRRCTPT